MIAANMGIGFWPEFTWGDIENEEIRLLEIIINYNKNKTDNQNVIAFYTFLTEFFEKRKKCSGE